MIENVQIPNLFHDRQLDMIKASNSICIKYIFIKKGARSNLPAKILPFHHECLFSLFLAFLAFQTVSIETCTMEISQSLFI